MKNNEENNKSIPNYKAHVLICHSCKYQNSEPDVGKKMKDSIKSHCVQKYGKSEIKVHGALCLGQCERGIACVIYPQAEWFTDLRPGDETDVIKKIDEIMK